MVPRILPTSPKLALIAGLVSAALIGGVLAAATDTFVFGDNVAESGDLGIDAQASEADVLIALTDPGDTTCELVDTFDDGPLVGTFSVDIDLAAIEPLPNGLHVATVAEQRICVLNGGTETARLVMEAVPSPGSDVDVLCSPGETGAGDTTCGTGEGELDEIVFVQMLNGGAALCPDGGAAGAFASLGAPPSDTGIYIPAGEACPFQIEIIVDDFFDEQLWIRAQTDRISFNVLVSLETP